MALLNVLDGTKLTEIVIKSTEYTERHDDNKKTGRTFNWIKNVWNSDEQRLKKEYKARGYQIEMEMEQDKYNLKINKL